MYYDQVFVLVKIIGFDDSVNIMFGLFFIRIFLDYGMVYSLVGMGNVCVDSFVVFICMVYVFVYLEIFQGQDVLI